MFWLNWLLLSEGRSGEAGSGAVAAGQGGGWPGAHCPVAPQHLQLVRQEMAVCPEQLSEFVDALRQYLRGTAGARTCLQ